MVGYHRRNTWSPRFCIPQQIITLPINILNEYDEEKIPLCRLNDGRNSRQLLQR